VKARRTDSSAPTVAPATPARRTRRRWTADEDATLARVTRSIGRRVTKVNWTAILATLPGRTRTAILSRRNELRIGSAGRRWTSAEDKILRDRWGEDAGRTLVKKLGRSESAIYLRAQALGLPPQSQGRTSATSACRTVGMWHDTLYRLLAECGLHPSRMALVRQRQVSTGGSPVLAVDLDAAEALIGVRDRRTVRMFEWARSEGVCGVALLYRLRKAALKPQSAGQVRYPIELLAEVDKARGGAAPAGPWVDLWRAVLAVPDLPCAPWVVALAARDLALGVGAEWTEHLPQPVAGLARRLARRLP